MRIHRSHPDENFTILPNATLQDDRLSCVALGILCQLISRPDGWNISADALWRQKKRHCGKKTGQGREAIRAAFVELEQYGYLVRHKTKGKGGQCITTLDLYDTPGHSEGEVEAQSAALPWDLVDEARRAAEERDGILNRRRAGRQTTGRRPAWRLYKEQTTKEQNYKVLRRNTPPRSQKLASPLTRRDESPSSKISTAPSAD